MLATLPFVLMGEDAQALVASYYGPGFYGGTTASGETFESNAMTAAHPSLPFGTILNIVGPNGKNVPVKINDRCACNLDLSEGAAEATGVKESGVAEVTATPVGASEDAPKPSEGLPALPSTGGSTS